MARVERRVDLLLGGRGPGDGAGAALDAGEILLGPGRLALGGDGEAERLPDRIEAALAHGDGLDHRHAEFGRQPLAIDGEAVAPGEIDHVERDHGGMAEADHLQGEAQMVVEIGRVEHEQHRVGQPFALLPAEDDVARDLLVRARRVEAVGAGQVDQLDRAAVVEREASRMALDRDSGIIADLLAGAGQHVEQGALAGIGVADHRDQGDGGHGVAGSTVIARAWARRIATIIRPILTASGSRPNGAACSASTATSSAKPRLRSLLASLWVSAAQSIPDTVAGVSNGSSSRLTRMSMSMAYLRVIINIDQTAG